MERSFAIAARPADEVHAGEWARWLPWILLLAALARVAIILATPHFVPWGDPADYQTHAASIAAGHGFPTTQIATPGTPSAFRPPAYPYLLGGLYALVGAHADAGRVLGAFLGVLSVLLVALVGRAFWSARVGLIAAALAAVFLPLITINETLLSESLFIPLELAMVLCLMACGRRPDQLRWALLSGALCAVAALTRSVADVWLLIALAVVLSAPAGRGTRIRSAVATLAAFVVVLIPWTVRNATVFHAFVPISTQDGFTLAGQYNPDSGADPQANYRLPTQVGSVEATLRPLYRRPGGVNEPQLDGALRHEGLAYLAHHPGHLIRASWYDSLRMFGVVKAFIGITYRELGLPPRLRNATVLSAQLLAVLALLALIARVTGLLRFRLGPWWLWGIPVVTFALTVPMVGNVRKRVFLDPFLLLLVAVSIRALHERLRTYRKAHAEGAATGVETGTP